MLASRTSMFHGRLFHQPVPLTPSKPRIADRCLMRPSPAPHPMSDLKMTYVLKSLSDLLLLELYQPDKGPWHHSDTHKHFSAVPFNFR